MSAIPSERPAFPPPAGGAAHALRTSQSAFFRAAMGVSPPAPAVASAPNAPARSAPPAAEAPPAARYQRPGSLLDIRV